MEQIQPASGERPANRIPESIASAAIIFDNKMYTGINHASAIRNLEKIHPNWRKTTETYPIEGFLTNTKRFVDRNEAGEIADKAEQLSHLSGEERSDAASNLDSYNLRH